MSSESEANDLRMSRQICRQAVRDRSVQPGSRKIIRGQCEPKVWMIVVITSFCSNGTAMSNCADRTPCLNGGICEIINNLALCRCADTYGGENCEIYFGHQHPCENHCENKGICTLKALDSVPHCHCIDGWHGSTCEIPDDCENYCLNGATCQYPRDNDYMPICLCKEGYTGSRCASLATGYSTAEDSHVETGQIIAGVAIGVTVVLLVVGMVCAAFYVIQRRRTHTPFTHSRLRNDNLEITNPIYLEDLGEEPTEREQPYPTSTDKINFANPVYETMYSASDSDNVRLMPGSEEKKGLLNHQQDDTSTT
ncbi:low-density lipoprotein receptor-related protein 1-like [Ctenocephalides felis]|uniref:low-density lipoprotein receptor-related protein 1-like n=1 Tax=Ctenocephalides felis TaxID=7515 RepID=UPI000E6E3B63|nr:low-density lipoprotein receptor-related protein 1-like [Ctenocephalides felis]